MCRLMGFVADSPTTFQEIVGPHFHEFVTLSNHHKDGWGCSTTQLIHKDKEPAAFDPEFKRLSRFEKYSGALLHFRLASSGLNVERSNSHPFAREGISFIHNGSVKPVEALEPFVDEDYLNSREGKTDSELYFLALLTQYRKDDLPEALLQTIRNIVKTGKHSSLNCMVLSNDYFIVAAEYDNSKIPAGEPDDYYKLSYRFDDEGLLIASSGWDQEGWPELPNHSIAVFNRHTQELGFLQI